MKISVGVARRRLHLGEPIEFEIDVTNDEAAPIDVETELGKCAFVVDKETKDSFARHGGNPSSVAVDAGESVTLRVAFEPTSDAIVARAPGVVALAIEIEGTLLARGTAHPFRSEVMPVEIDLLRVRPLLTPAGEASVYVVDGEDVFYVSRKSRRAEPRTRKLGVNPVSVRVLSTSYLVDDDAVYRDGVRLRGVSSVGFRVFNAIYAGNAEVILTPYGDAKVDDPRTFEVLDSGDNVRFPSGYRGGYARDQHVVYYFTEETSTAHALRVKACKAPSTFVALPNAAGRDASNVYLEATRISKANPKTWRALSATHSVDEKRAFYLTREIPGADPATFEVIREAMSGPLSIWARDARSYYERETPRTEAEYLEGSRRT